jgi:hypothetical protein
LEVDIELSSSLLSYVVEAGKSKEIPYKRMVKGGMWLEFSALASKDEAKLGETQG